MSNPNNPNTNDLAATIRRRLERSAEAARAEPTVEPVGRLRATKDGELLAPGEVPPVGPDGKPAAVMVVPDGTFHSDGGTRVILIDKVTAREIRRLCVGRVDEQGGALFGSPKHGDILDQAEAPPRAERSPVMIRLRGEELEEGARAALARTLGAVWLGAWHLHLDGPNRLSGGDLRQIERLHDDPRIPPCGFVKVLAVRHGLGPVELKAFVSPAKGIVEQVDLYEVDDVARARARLSAAPALPPARASHVLGHDAGSRRFALELAELEAGGYEVAADVSLRGVVLVLSHRDLAGDLVVTLGAEGWERPPRVEHRVDGVAKLLTSPLTTLLSAWSSAFSLVDLVAAARTRGAWPRRTGLRLARSAKGAA